MTTLTAARVMALAADWPFYQNLRAQHPGIPALVIWRYMRGDEPGSLYELACAHSNRGHDWVIADEDSGREGRSYCCRCGADGDA